MHFQKYFFVLIFTAVLLSCNKNDSEKESIVGKLFEVVKSETSGIQFANIVTENDTINYFTYPYIYMGGGVAIGDINNDGLQDIFFTGNVLSNKLYLNKGELRFEDITKSAGLETINKWCTGVTMGDVNGDGYLDIYVSVSGPKESDKRNLLYINNKDLTFTEEGEIRGIADEGHSTQTTFFDYDNDGDLDAYVANYPITNFANTPEYYKYQIENVRGENSDKLYSNDGKGFFKDMTEAANLLSYGLSLSATIGDFNQDGWADIYVSNDFATPDYFYINNRNGTFSEHIKEVTNQTSFYGMGVDIADYNNDGFLDILQLDMTPEDNFRSKSNMASMDIELFWSVVYYGFHFQYMQNSLQLNNGIRSDGLPFFSNLSRLGGVALTDWSWSPLFLDMDNDGWKDIFVTNGSKRDINNKDFFKKIEKLSDSVKLKNLLELSNKIPSTKISNYAYLNNKNLRFKNASIKTGLDYKGFSNGSAYGDLDNDGDIDLVINNADTLSMVFENQSNILSKNTFLRFKPNGSKGNPFGIGLKITILSDSLYQFQELTLTRGFQSSSEPLIHFGTGNTSVIDKAIIVWPDGKQQTLTEIKTNQVVEVNYKDAKIIESKDTPSNKPILTSITNRPDLIYKHTENYTNDYSIQPLLPHKLSQLGPNIVTGDVNNDGLEDFFIGGASGQAGKLFVQQNDGLFSEKDGPWKLDSKSEDMGVLLFDADSDNDLDLYVVSGGNNVSISANDYQDRIYINNGNGVFTKSKTALPKMNTSGSCVVSTDFDSDGDLDLFVGGRLIPHKYPLAPRSYLLRNDSQNGELSFTDVTEELAPELLNPGMVTSSLWIDMDGDADEDLVITGEWMPISIFENNGGKFLNKTDDYGFENTTGWWYSLIAEDFDNDGDKDIVAGNLGLNYKYQASEDETFDIYAFDYDNNKRLDIVLGYYYQGEQYPVRGRQCSSEQIPALQYKFKNYGTFANATLEDVYSKENLKASLHYQAKNFASSYIENLGNKNFSMTKLPNKAQVSSINGIISKDFNHDGNLDILVIGNLFTSEIETPRNDASIGLILTGDGSGNFTPLSMSESGLFAPKDAKAVAFITTKLGDIIIVTNNNDNTQVFSVNTKE
jgi:hypothetical protein